MIPVRDIVRAAEALEAAGNQPSSKRCLVGFDGFVDEIIHVVDTRQDKDTFARIPTISDFAQRIASAAGKSANIELVTQIEKIGGNGPLMTMGLASLGKSVTCIGLMGYPAVLPVFEPLQAICDVISVGNPGHTDALEFLDGKLMLGKQQTLKDLNWARLLDVCGRERLAALVNESALVACTNWTMLTEMEEILEQLPLLLHEQSETIFFFDLADPQKRSSQDVDRVLRQMQALNARARTILGLNLREAEQVSSILGLDATIVDDAAGLARAGAAIQQAMGIWGVIIHSVKFAGGALGEQQAGAQGPFCPQPKLSTGAGDHFNGGFCSALLDGLALEDALYGGVATSGWYVRNAQSPQRMHTVELLRQWAEGTLDRA